MATTTSSTLRSYYTWDDAEFSWGAQQCNNQFNWFGIYDHSQQSAISVNIGENLSCQIESEKVDGINLSDAKSNDIHVNFTESIGASETYWDIIGYLMNFLESVRLTDGITHEVAKTKKEVVGVNDSQAYGLAKNLSEALTVDEQPSHTLEFHRQFAEMVLLAELFKQNIRTNSSEDIYVSESDYKRLSQVLQESVNLNELYNHIARIKRTVSEAVRAQEGQSSVFGKNESENVQVRDIFLKACEGVLSDVGIYDGSITLDDFLKIIKQPSGYEPFIPYVVGEYEYDKALVRLLVKAGSMGSQPAVYDAVINVDIDDTVDRGTTDITDTSAATKIYFNKHYYTKPEVAVTLQGGNTADGVITPNIVTIAQDDDGYYFTVELLKANGTRTTGRITWNSVGY